ncbi:MAG: helix-turn-helix domain-containing protein, partial [Bacteroidota bacterium]
LPDLFYKTLKIKDSLNFIPGIIINTLHLAEYYTAYKDTVKALDYAHKTRKLAASSDNFRNLLESLALLSRLEPGEQGKTYLYEHIRLSDSLQKAERKLRNKFFRIRFETDQLKLEREKLIGQKAIFGNWIVSLSIFIVLISGITYYYYHRQRLYKLRFKALLSEKEIPEYQMVKKPSSEQVSDVNISETALNHIRSQLAVFVSEKQYLDKTVSLNQLAKAMDTNPKYLSHVVNFYEQKSFIDYIKDLRIGYVLEALKSDAVLRKYSIKAIASEVGFNTSEAFSKAFYKKTGLYPSYFIKELDKTLVEQVQVT